MRHLFHVLKSPTIHFTHHGNVHASLYVHDGVSWECFAHWMICDILSKNMGSCVFRLQWYLNDLLQTSQVYGLSPLCTRLWVFRVPCTLNALLHTSQEKGRSPLCMRWCFFMLLWSLNDLLHTSHEYRRSPVCIITCLFSLPKSLKDFVHTSQKYGRSPVCTRSFGVVW